MSRLAASCHETDKPAITAAGSFGAPNTQTDDRIQDSDKGHKAPLPAFNMGRLNPVKKGEHGTDARPLTSLDSLMRGLSRRHMRLLEPMAASCLDSELGKECIADSGKLRLACVDAGAYAPLRVVVSQHKPEGGSRWLAGVSERSAGEDGGLQKLIDDLSKLKMVATSRLASKKEATSTNIVLDSCSRSRTGDTAHEMRLTASNSSSEVTSASLTFLRLVP